MAVLDCSRLNICRAQQEGRNCKTVRAAYLFFNLSRNGLFAVTAFLLSTAELYYTSYYLMHSNITTSIDHYQNAQNHITNFTEYYYRIDNNQGNITYFIVY